MGEANGGDKTSWVASKSQEGGALMGRAFRDSRALGSNERHV